jgi:hypothetical protein
MDADRGSGSREGMRRAAYESLLATTLAYARSRRVRDRRAAGDIRFTPHPANDGEYLTHPGEWKLAERRDSLTMNFTPEQIERDAGFALGGKRTSSHRKFRTTSPIHGGSNPNFTFDLDTGLWYCHSNVNRVVD